MFHPRYQITPRLLANIKRVAVLAADLNRHPWPDDVVAEFERQAAALSAHTSTRIEGNPLPLTEVKRLLKSLPVHLRDSEREVANYNDALLALNMALKKGRPGFSLKLVLGIHKTVMKGLIEPYHGGRLRAEPVVVNDPGIGATVYLPPDHTDVEPLMLDLVSFVASNRKTMDPLILAGLFHKQFVIIHPFVDGNGRTARLATKVLLAALGIDTFPLFSFESYYSRNVSRYFREVGLSGNYYEQKETVDFTPWLGYFSDGIIDEMLRVSGDLEATSASLETTVRPHHQVILDYLERHGFITDRDYAQLTDRARATRALDFGKLMALGRLERHGRGKNTHYKLKR